MSHQEASDLSERGTRLESDETNAGNGKLRNDEALEIDRVLGTLLVG